LHPEPPLDRSGHLLGSRQRHVAHRGFARHERGHGLLVLFRQDRAGRVEHPPPGGQDCGRSAQYRELRRRESRHVARAPQELDIRVAADDARRGARRIDEDALEWTAVPEGCGIARIPDMELRCAPQTLQILRDQPDPWSVNVERRDLGALTQKLEEVTGLSARRRTRNTRIPGEAPSSSAASCAPAS